MRQNHYSIIIAVVALIIAIAAAWPAPVKSNPRLGVTNLDSVHLQDTNATAVPNFVADQLGTGAIAEFRDASTPVALFPNGGGLTINSGGLTVTSGGANVVGGALIAGGGIRLSVQTAAITDGFSITPAASYINITSTIEVTSSTSVGLVTTTATIGDLVVLRNGNASDAVHVDGTGGSIDCKANVDLAAADTLTLLFTGSVWNCLSSYDNS